MMSSVPLSSRSVGSGQDLVLIHGFLGSGSSFHRLTERLSHAFRCIAVDLPGHGVAPPSEDNGYGIDVLVDRMRATLESQPIERPWLLGYSMGGRIALHFALAHAEMISGLILESANPGIENESERQHRLLADTELADSIVANGMENFTRRWASQPLFESQQRLPGEVRDEIQEARLATDPTSASLYLTRLSPGAIRSVWADLSGMSIPTLAIAGQLDTKYVAIMERIGSQMPHARTEIIAGAGHAVHLEQPRLMAESVLNFAQSTAELIEES
jgi:2-succinyl-6-hydroxy-2,4-cyclohexadiene-1-carboxylate synthase